MHVDCEAAFLAMIAWLSTPAQSEVLYTYFREWTAPLRLPSTASRWLSRGPCAAQVNLDFDSEACMADTLRLACALQPVATALLACSPFRHGKPTGYLSWRAHAWASIEDHR